MICEIVERDVPKKSAVPKRESALKSALMQEIKRFLPPPRYIAFRHEDVRSSGIPDMSVTAHQCTSWWEAKHAAPDFFTFGLQELTCKRLAQVGYCRYIIWYEVPPDVRTLIVHPGNLLDLLPETETKGINHRFVVEFIRSVHESCAVRLR